MENCRREWDSLRDSQAQLNYNLAVTGQHAANLVTGSKSLQGSLTRADRGIVILNSMGEILRKRLDQVGGHVIGLADVESSIRGSLGGLGNAEVGLKNKATTLDDVVTKLQTSCFMLWSMITWASCVSSPSILHISFILQRLSPPKTQWLPVTESTKFSPDAADVSSHGTAFSAMLLKPRHARTQIPTLSISPDPKPKEKLQPRHATSHDYPVGFGERSPKLTRPTQGVRVNHQGTQAPPEEYGTPQSRRAERGKAEYAASKPQAPESSGPISSPFHNAADIDQSKVGNRRWASFRLDKWRRRRARGSLVHSHHNHRDGAHKAHQGRQCPCRRR